MRYSFLILALFLAGSAGAQRYVSNDLIGKWQGVDQHHLFGVVEIINDHQLEMSSAGPGKLGFTYTVNFGRQPAWLDLYRDSAGQRSTLKGLIQFLDKNHLKWQIFPDGNRPNGFVGDMGNMITLVRLKS